MDVWPKEEPVDVEMDNTPLELPPAPLEMQPPSMSEAMMFASPEMWISSLPSESYTDKHLN